MPEESLLTDDVRALIGSAVPLSTVQVTRRAYQRALDVYLGEHDQGPAEGEDVPGYVIEALNSETDPPPIPALMPQSILISNEWQFERPLRMGETLEKTHRIVDISERFGGRFGYSINVRTEVALSEPGSGVVVARNVHTMTQYNAADARDGGES
ncbi:MAG: hypothetical protein C0506_11185 [Anaerolinea sp.]|nr:hypothetical protein [Anaerolinea sp.]